MNKRHYEHTLPNIRGSLSNTYQVEAAEIAARTEAAALAEIDLF